MEVVSLAFLGSDGYCCTFAQRPQAGREPLELGVGLEVNCRSRGRVLNYELDCKAKDYVKMYVLQSIEVAVSM